LLSVFLSGDQFSPALAALPDGGFVLAHTDLIGGNRSVIARRYEAGSA
jgi:hypothetical protein